MTKGSDEMTPQEAIDYIDNMSGDDTDALDFAEDYTDGRFGDWSMMERFKDHDIEQKETVLYRLDQSLHENSGWYEVKDGSGTYGTGNSKKVKDIADTIYRIDRSPRQYYHTSEGVVGCDSIPADSDDAKEVIQELAEDSEADD